MYAGSLGSSVFLSMIFDGVLVFASLLSIIMSLYFAWMDYFESQYDHKLQPIALQSLVLYDDIDFRRDFDKRRIPAILEKMDSTCLLRMQAIILSSIVSKSRMPMSYQEIFWMSDQTNNNSSAQNNTVCEEVFECGGEGGGWKWIKKYYNWKSSNNASNVSIVFPESISKVAERNTSLQCASPDWLLILNNLNDDNHEYEISESRSVASFDNLVLSSSLSSSSSSASSLFRSLPTESSMKSSLPSLNASMRSISSDDDYYDDGNVSLSLSSHH